MGLDEALILLASSLALAEALLLAARVSFNLPKAAQRALCEDLSGVINATARALRDGCWAVVILPEPATLADKACLRSLSNIALENVSSPGCLLLYKDGEVVRVRGC